MDNVDKTVSETKCENCEDCGITIPATYKQAMFLGSMDVRQTRCDGCAYEQTFRYFRTRPCPYKTPFPRRKTNGKLPKDFYSMIGRPVPEGLI